MSVQVCKCCRQDFEAGDADQVVCDDCHEVSPNFASLMSAFARGEQLSAEEEKQLANMMKEEHGEEEEEQEENGLPF